MRHGDITTDAVECATTVVYLGLSWGFLISLSAAAASFLEIILFASRRSLVLTDVDLRELNLGSRGNDGNFVNALV